MRVRLLSGVAAALVLAPGSAHLALAQAGDPATGWWSRSRLGTPVEAPDTVPEGGLHVAGGPSGRLGVSALRAELAPDMRATALTLDVEDSQGTVAVTVCAVTAAWEPVEGGRLEDAPPEDCALPAQGVVQDGKLLVTLDAASPAGPLDVVLLPTDGSVFTLDLQKPTAASVTAEPAATDLGALPDPSTGFGADAGESFDSPPMTDAAPFLPPPDLGSAAAPAPFLAGELPTLPGSGPAETPPAPVIAGTPPLALSTVPTAGEALDPRRHAVPAALLFGVLIAFAMRLQAQPVRAPRALGGAARARSAAPDVAAPVDPERGVGRLKRDRSEPVVRI